MAVPTPRGLTVAAVMLSTIMPMLDTTIANVSLPHMQGSMSATQDQIAWVLTSYIVASAIMTAPAGVLAARLGRKPLFVVAVAGFTIASVLCGAAQSLAQLVAFRIAQGVFGAALVPLSQAVLLDIYPREKHGHAMALWGIGVILGPILGPTLGGWLTEAYNWRWVFYINLPVGVLALLGIMAFVPDSERQTRRRFDAVGFVFFAIAIGALQLMLDRGESLDWFSSREIVIETVAAGLFTYLFVVHIFTTSHPFIEPGILRDRNFAAGLLLILAVGVVHLGTLALLPPFLQNIMDFPVLTTGLTLMPRGLGTFIAVIIVSRVSARVDARLLILIGLMLNTFSLWALSGFTVDVSVTRIAWVGTMQGLGLGFILVPLSAVAFSTLTQQYRSEGTALFSLLRNFGGSIGISVVATLLAQNTQLHHARIAETMTPFRVELYQPFLPAIWDWHALTGLVALNREVTRQAASIAYINNFFLLMLITLPSGLLLLLLRPGAQQARVRNA